MSFYKRRRPKQEEEKCADPAKARVRALDALASREMSSAQLYERLCYGFTEQAAAAAVAEMVELDYVNDDRYAKPGHTACLPPARAAVRRPRTCGRRAFPARRSSRRWKTSMPRTQTAKARSWKLPPLWCAAAT